MKTVKTVLLCMFVSLLVNDLSADVHENFYRPTGRTVRDVAVDENYAWCATDDGLLRWSKSDGSYRFYTTNNGLSYNYTLAVAIDGKKTVWVGSYNGVGRLDGDTFTMFQVDESGKSLNTIQTLFIDDDGNIWCGTYTGGVLCYNGVEWMSYTMDNSGLGVNNIGSIAGKDGVMWFAPAPHNEGGLFRFDGTTWTHYTTDNSDIPSDNITDVTIGADGTLWFTAYVFLYEGRYGYVPCSFDGENWRRFYTFDVNDMAVAPDGGLWIVNGNTADPLGMRSYDGEKWTDLSDITARFPSNILSLATLAFDSDGSIWFTAYNSMSTQTLVRYSEPDVIEYYVDGPVSRDFQDVLFDDDGILWLGTDVGLISFDGADFENIAFDFDKYVVAGSRREWGSYVKALEMDKDGIIWAGTLCGIWSYDGVSWMGHFPYEDLSWIWVRDIAVDENNVKWFAASNGLVSYDNGEWKTYEDDSLRNLDSIAVDREHCIWGINSAESLIIGFDGSSVREYSGENCPVRGYVYNVAVDTDNVKWFGSSNGLWSLDGDTWTDYSEKILSHSDYGDYGFTWFHTIVVDDFDVKWFVSMKGLVSFDGTDWIEYDNDETGSFRYVIPDDDTIWVVGSKNLRSFTRSDMPVVGVEEAPSLPARIAITGNYPNPFNPSTTIEFYLPESGFTVLAVYNIAGQKIRTLVSSDMTAGRHSVMWNGRDDDGNAVSSGVYVSRLKMGGNVSSGSMLLIK